MSDRSAGVEPSGYTQASSVGPSKGVTTKRMSEDTVPFTTSVRIEAKAPAATSSDATPAADYAAVRHP